MKIPGYYDTLHHEPIDLIIFHELDLPNVIESWKTIYVHDTRLKNGELLSNEVKIRIMNAMSVFQENINYILKQLMIWPDGRPELPHCVGGGYVLNKITFYIARNMQENYLCANIY